MCPASHQQVAADPFQHTTCVCLPQHSTHSTYVSTTVRWQQACRHCPDCSHI
jgi:hypothetical protein